jgi:hypothetical protein
LGIREKEKNNGKEEIGQEAEESQRPKAHQAPYRFS